MLTKIKSALKIKIRKKNWFNNQYSHKLQAKAVLKALEAEKGKTNPLYKKLSEEYAQDVLGWIGFAPWLNTYSAARGEFKEGWIPVNYFEGIVLPKITGLYNNNMCKAKTLAAKLINSVCFPDVAYYVNGLFFTSAWEVLLPKGAEGYIFSQTERVVFKLDNSAGGGRGIYILTRTTFDTEKICKLGNGVFQKYIQQHELFERIMPNSVATLRLTSVIENSGKISCRAAHLKIGRIEDLCVRPSSSIVVMLDLISGELHEKGYFHRDWRSVNQHPDTGEGFLGKVIPKFNECITSIIEAHSSIPFYRVIGWDIVVDKNNEIQFMEFEMSTSAIAEAIQGPCFTGMEWEKLKPICMPNDCLTC